MLIQPPIEDFYLTRKRTIPYGLACIAAVLQQNNFQVDIIDALATNKSKIIPLPEAFKHLEIYYGKPDISRFSLFHHFRHFGYSLEHIGTQVRDKKLFAVGISSLFTPYADMAMACAQIVKKFSPDTIVIMGGHHPTTLPEEVIDSPFVDYVLRGDGERSMTQLCKILQTQKDPSAVPGIAFKKNGITHISEPCWENNFDDLPLPAMDLINKDFYQRSRKGSSMIVASRGCPMKCSYCSVSAESASGPFRKRSADHVFKEVEKRITQDDAGFIDFEDENLCLKRSWFMDLFSRIKQLTAEKDIEFRAMNGLFAPTIDTEILELMKACGFKTLNLALASASQEQLKRFRRPDVQEDFNRVLGLAKEQGLDCISYIIAAAPGQSAEASLEDLLYLAERKTLVGLSIFYPAPGSHDYDTCNTLNLLPEDLSLARSSALPVEHTTTRDQAVTLLRLSRILNYMKSIIDTQGCLPGPEKIPLSPALPSDRDKASLKLLQYFLDDGKIRGITPKGDIYEHRIDLSLTKKFIEQMNDITICGVN